MRLLSYPTKKKRSGSFQLSDWLLESNSLIGYEPVKCLILCKTKTNKRFHNGKFLEDMKVTVFEGSTEDIISKVKESDSNLFKVAVVEDIGPRSFCRIHFSS